jgi:predicted TIM-barrel fold metal-dependent hydrolase
MKAPYRYISADSHLEVPPDRWRDRVPAQHRERAPRLIQLSDGTDAWLVENRPLYQGGNNSSAGRPYDTWDPTRMKYEGQAGTGPAEQRLQEQDMDGIDAEVLFPTVGGRSSWGGISDDEAYLAVVRAYNDFLWEEYCAVAPDRLIGMALMPERGLDTALEEMERCARLGFKGINLNKFPNGSAFPSRKDDTFWTAALDLGLAVTIHSNLEDDSGARQRAGRGEGQADPAIGVGLRSSKFALLGARDVLLMASTGVFDRFPELQIYLAEVQVGWVPNCMEQADILYQRHHPWWTAHRGFTPMPEPPSFYLKRNVLWGFYDNPVGVVMRHYMGVEHLMWLTDFPHGPSDWPNSLDVVARNFAGVPEDETQLMVCGNAVRFFHLDPTFETTDERERRVQERRSQQGATLAGVS